MHLPSNYFILVQAFWEKIGNAPSNICDLKMVMLDDVGLIIHGVATVCTISLFKCGINGQKCIPAEVLEKQEKSDAIARQLFYLFIICQ